MRHLFLVNPAAGKVDASHKIYTAARKLAEALGEPCEVRISTAPGDCKQLTRQAGQTGESVRVYACGGVGTFNEVVEGALGFPNLSVTSIPCGSGNDFIKQFRNPGAFYDLEAFRTVREDLWDVMDVSGRACINICSAGFDARIGTDIAAYRRMPLLGGSRAYTASIVVNLIRGVVKPCRVEFPDGTVIDEPMTLVCVCNGSWYGGGYHPVPEADSRDGYLDVLVVKKVSRLTVAKVIAAYQRGKYRDYPELIHYKRVKRVQISTPEEEPFNLDGELLRTKEVTVEARPGALRVFSPVAAWCDLCRNGDENSDESVRMIDKSVISE